MTNNQKKYLKYYILAVGAIILMFLALKNLSTGDSSFLSYYRLLDLILAVSISMYIYYNGSEKKEGLFNSFCCFECNQDKDKVDIFYTYIMAVPTFLYILITFTLRDKIPSFLFSFTAIILILYIFSFIGYKICYYNKNRKPILDEENKL